MKRNFGRLTIGFWRFHCLIGNLDPPGRGCVARAAGSENGISKRNLWNARIYKYARRLLSTEIILQDYVPEEFRSIRAVVDRTDDDSRERICVYALRDIPSHVVFVKGAKSFGRVGWRPPIAQPRHARHFLKLCDKRSVVRRNVMWFYVTLLRCCK